MDLLRVEYLIDGVVIGDTAVSCRVMSQRRRRKVIETAIVGALIPGSPEDSNDPSPPTTNVRSDQSTPTFFVVF